MKTILTSLALAAIALTLAAQTTAPKPPVHHTPVATTHPVAVPSCVKLPELSPKIPALPAGTPCAKSLLSFISIPSVRLDYVSPLVDPGVRDALGLEPTTFSLDYSEIKVGTGELALPHKYYTVQYTGYLVDGTKFDSSLDRPDPFVFPIGAHKVIAGWDLGTQGMHIGGKRRLYIPWQLAYGDRGQPPTIPARAELIFDIEILSQSDNPPAPKTPPTPPPAAKPTTPPPAAATPPPAAKAPAAAAPAPATTAPSTH